MYIYIYGYMDGWICVRECVCVCLCLRVENANIPSPSDIDPAK